ncbi:hypothetical protein [Pseudooceanicola sp. HF7]|uniref:hypothetical protein n=1 Tax=Pseudooceanicola sp. HF7 TaxID=2721560 RepID=UPI00142FDE24|nr:hypothetical protein [Pseudooceanicola sp. HF7]NIZ09793.1 hypothetical protein [Pseudooceanicola sp. HF7]
MANTFNAEISYDDCKCYTAGGCGASTDIGLKEAIGSLCSFLQSGLEAVMRRRGVQRAQASVVA